MQTEKWTMVQALNHALGQELARDRRVVIMGEDVGTNGGVFRVTDGLQVEFGEERVFDTPLAESGIVGTAIGMAIYGLRPVVEMQFSAFSFTAFNQIGSQATRMRYRSAGEFTVPMLIRGPFGGGVRTPEFHSDNFEAIFMHMQGIKVVIPSDPYSAKGLLHAAIEDPDPVFFFEHMKLYRSFKQDVPVERYTLPLGKAAVLKEGTDLSLITYGQMVRVSQDAIKQVEADQNVSIELIDLRSIAPIDQATLIESVSKTGRAVVVHEAARTGGVGAEVIALINEHCLYSLLKPIARVTGPDSPYPMQSIEDIHIPIPTRVAAAIRETLQP